MRRLIAFGAGFITIFVSITVLVAVYFYFAAPDRYNVLIIGSDQRADERARSDILFVLSMPKDADKEPFFLSIPRDTKIEHEEWGLEKITHFYALGERPDDGKVLGNVDLTQSVVEELLDIEVDATVEVTFQSFEEIVAEMGGATINGQQVDEREAIASIRDRFSDGRSDFDRQADSREVMRSLITKLKSPENAKTMLAYFEESEQARLDYKKVKGARFAAGMFLARRGKLEIGEMEEESVPGESAYLYTPDFGAELYYWIVDEPALSEIVDEHFR
jgi:anionic cell wall polymer biosynthesis LytR-Cps2A-Psr (LCP) family protein